MYAHAERLAGEGLRVLAFAEADGVRLDAGLEPLRGKLRLLGLIAQSDPLRPEVPGAVQRCRQAGIRTVMVTGDHKQTARAIAAELGMSDEEEVIDGAELDALTDDELRDRLKTIAVFARVRPAQKLRIVASYQRRGEVVAMTGDGVNDAPALVKADVGVAMGRSGTEVAKEAAKILISDDNFASIVAAIEEGRVVYRNIQKAVLLLLSTSIAEVTVLLLALLLGLPAPFAPVQILWNNLVTEGLITVNLVMEPAEGDEMKQPPIPPRQALLHRPLVRRLMTMSCVIVAITLGWYQARLAMGVPLKLARSETFTLLAVCEWFNVLNCRSSVRSALRMDLLRNPWLLGGLLLGIGLQGLVVFWRPLGDLFHTLPFDVDVVLEIAILGSFVLWVEELRKWRARRRSRRTEPLAARGPSLIEA
jgi:magnesium-transporting ATPase (P-type)